MKSTIKLALVAAVLFTLSGCTSQSDAKRALSAESYTNINYTGYDFFACSEDDFYHTGFSATNSNGKVVNGTVCSGLIFKSATIRY